MKKNTKNKYKKNLIIILPIVIFLSIISLLFLGVSSYLDNSAYFRIKKVVLNGLDDERIAQNISSNLLYDNIFSLDLNKIKEDLKIENPQFHDVELVRNFPDQLTINVAVRKPIAQIKQKGFFLIDDDGVIVSDRLNRPVAGSLVILGLSLVSDLSFGKKINLTSLKSGLNLVSALEGINRELISLIPGLTNDKIEIDISKYPSLFVRYDTLELRFYNDNLIKGLNSLNRVLPSLREKIGKVEYIDLRFGEPAVSFKK